MRLSQLSWFDSELPQHVKVGAIAGDYCLVLQLETQRVVAQIPCIIGTKHATSILKDGDLVEVDAGKGTVKKL